jgi:osmoprotectant transport system permease protein
MNLSNSTFLQFMASQGPSLLEKTGQQIYLVSTATFLSIMVGIPLALLAHYYKRLRALILSIANVVQTIPSLALLAFLLPFFGIGPKPALIAMALYGLLPIVRATLTGIESVSPQLRETATATGLTAYQTLTLLELPLAVPNIISGIKTSAVINVGVATLAAFIGAGGLGDFIMRGLAVDSTRLVLLGAIPAALLALFIDGFIGFLAKLSDRRVHRPSDKKLKYRLWIILLVIAALIIGIAVKFLPLHHKRTEIVIASKNFTESLILAELTAIMIEDHTHIKVVRKLNLGSTVICQQAMLNKQIDIYPEYTGTAYPIILHQPYRSNLTTQAIYDTVKTAYKKQFDIVWLQPFGFNNSQGIAVRAAMARKYHLKTISDLKKVPPQLSFAAPSEAFQRADGVLGLREIYGLSLNNTREMEMSLMYDALHNKRVDASLVFTTDGRIPKYHLQVLIDDKHIFPPYYAAPVIRGAVLKRYPQIETALAPLANLLDEKTMQQLNAKVDIDHETPHEVALAFLEGKGLVDK